MKLFTVNQVNQVYVIPASAEVASNPTELKTATEGSFYVGKLEDGVYVAHKGKGGVTRTDLIENVMWAKKTPAINDALLLPAYKISLADGKDISSLRGETLILTMSFNGYIGISPEDSTYFKYGDVKVNSTMTEGALWAYMARSVAINMKNESNQFLKVFVVDNSGSSTEVTATIGKSAFESLKSANNKGIVIKMTEPDWVIGLKQQRVMDVKFIFNTVNTNAGDEVWGKSELIPVESNTVTTSHNVAKSTLAGNGKIAADYEYFFHGERGDQFRLVGYPNVVLTNYMVDPSKTYDFVQIHYAYIGSNESVQKSEKDVTFLIDPSMTDDVVGKLSNKGISITNVAAKDWVTSTGGESASDEDDGE